MRRAFLYYNVWLQFPGGAAAVSGVVSVGAAANPTLALLKVGQIGNGLIGHQPDIQQAHSNRGENVPSDKAQIQNKEVEFHAPGLLAAKANGLACGERGVSQQVIGSKAIAVSGDDPGEDEQQGPGSRGRSRRRGRS